MDPVSALLSLGGAARWPALQARGVGRSTLLAACGAGLVLRPARGLFVLPFARDDVRVRAMAARGQLSCAHAALAHGLEVFATPDAVHVRIPRGSSRAVPTRRTTAHEWGRSGPGGTTELIDTLQDCARCLDLPDAVAVLDSALRTGRIGPDELTRLAAGWRGRAGAAVRLADPQAQSVLESVGRVLLVDAGIGPIASQVHAPRVGWVDLVIDGWLVIELDGFATHRAAFREDRRRDAELTRLGFVVLRFTYADLLSRREWFVEVVRETLSRGRPPFGWPRSLDSFAAPDDDRPTAWTG